MREHVNLRYWMYEAPQGHPQHVMKELGITYTCSVPQSIADQWWFLNCKNVPEVLPPYIVQMTGDFDDLFKAGGLTREMVERLKSETLPS